MGQSRDPRQAAPLTDALEHFGDRLGLEEARLVRHIDPSNPPSSAPASPMRCASTATICATSGSRAPQEKAYALPAKLTVPMMVCIFPVLSW